MRNRTQPVREDNEPEGKRAREVTSSERCRPIDFAALRKEAARRDAAADQQRTQEETPMKRAHVRMLQRFSVEAEVLKEKEPEKYTAVEREVEKLREVRKLADATVLKTEIVRHAGRMAAEADSSVRQKLYTRTLALATLHQEKLDLSAERKDTPIVPMQAQMPMRTHAEPSTTEPRRLLVEPEPRPLPDLSSFADRDPTPSPLERRVQRIVLPPAAAPVMKERDTDPIRDNDTSRVFVSFVSQDTRERPRSTRSQDSPEQARDIELSLSDISVIRAVEDVVPDARGTKIERSMTPQVREVFRDASTAELPKRPIDRDARYADDRRLRENERESMLVRSMYESERRYLDVRTTEPERGERVLALASTLRFAPELKTREQALTVHGQAWQRRALEKDRKLWRTQEDNLMATALVARERDDEHHASTRMARERLADEGRRSQGAERAALAEELRSFLSRDFSLDAQACRREMNAALTGDGGDDPRVYALALETHPHRPFRSPDDARVRPVPRPVFDEERTQIGQVDIERMKSELVDLRVSFAFKELSHAGLLRAERIIQVLDSVASRTAEEAV